MSSANLESKVLLPQTIVKFAVVGLCGNLINLATFSVLIGLDAGALGAAILAFIVSNVIGYLLHREWTFGNIHHENSGLEQGGKFLIVSLVSLVVSLVFLHLFHHFLPLIPAQFFALQTASVCNLIGNRYWTFAGTVTV